MCHNFVIFFVGLLTSKRLRFTKLDDFGDLVLQVEITSEF